MTTPPPPLVDPRLSGAPGRPLNDETRCALCGEPLRDGPEEGCVPGVCATRPQPARFHDVPRLCREYHQMILDDGIVHRFYVAREPELSPSAASARPPPAR